MLIVSGQLSSTFRAVLSNVLSRWPVAVLHARCLFMLQQNIFRRRYIASAIFGRVGRIASKDIILQLINTKCIPILVYGLEAFSVTQIRSISH